MISDNVKKIKLELEGKETKLIAVSKTQSIDKIMEAYNEGVRDFGENRVQELEEKIKSLPNDINWHMIGHLQTNKVKDIIDKVSLIHSVDSVKLANVINTEAKKKNIVANILLEINIGNEPTKFGFKVQEINDVINSLKDMENIRIKGFMCVAPKTDNSENSRIYFEEMNTIKNKFGYDILSMGMSGDYKVAIDENSSYIRIGTGIFGPRT
jgi:pyridoxal phosphate enzyme (YggS family)